MKAVLLLSFLALACAAQASSLTAALREYKDHPEYDIPSTLQETLPLDSVLPDNRDYESPELVEPRFVASREGVVTQVQTGAKADEKFVGLAMDAVNAVGNFAMDKMGVPEDSTGRKVFNAVSDPVGTAIDMGADAMGVPEDSPLRTAAHAGSFLLCFGPDTPVTMADGSAKPIQAVLPGDMTQGGKVKAIMKFATLGARMYSYKGVVVAGGHKVLENGAFVAVRNSFFGVALNETVATVFDLTTSAHRIYVGDITFADFDEVDQSAVPRVAALEAGVLQSLAAAITA